jgi:disulfide bond formation protein DsbB
MTPRLGAALGAIACALLLGYAYYLQYVDGLDPCPLCMVQRGFFYAILAVFAVAALHAPRGKLSWLYAGLVLFFAAGGAATAGRQVWLQSLPADQVPQCGPDLAFMLENFALSRTLEKLFYGSGQCAAVDWKFLGLSIAGWALVWFVGLALYAIWLALRSSRRTTPAS